MLGLPEPTFSFTIPSLHDEKLLTCRIYQPNDVGQQGSKKRGAIIAHSYAPLGGCYDDPIVGIVGNEILRNGWVVMTFNFRGAGDSQGRTSWTSKAECADYASVAGLLIQFLALLDPGSSSTNLMDTDKRTSIDLIVGGYSYGSMIANHLPPVPSLLAPFGMSTLSNAAEVIMLRAEHLAAQIKQCPTEPHLASSGYGVSNPQSELSSFAAANVVTSTAPIGTEHRNNRPSLDAGTQELHLRSASDDNMPTAAPTPTNAAIVLTSLAHFDFPIHTHYLLVSPLLPPVATLTALPFSSHTSHEEHMKKLATNATLVIYGEEDGFTSSKKLNAWSRELAKVNPHFQGVEIKCAGHFWREPGVAQGLVETIGVWVARLTERDTKL